MYGDRTDGGAPQGSRAATRYLFTMQEDITFTIFKPIDREILKWLWEDNRRIEPEYFAPVICMTLINGAEGIASGFSTKIPCYNPEDISRYTREWLKSEDGDDVFADLAPLKPWYRGFKGTIELSERKVKGVVKRSWKSRGMLTKNDKKKGVWDVTELPIGLWTGTFKTYLESLMRPTDKKSTRSVIRSFKEYHTTNTVHFEITPTKGFTPDIDTKGNMTVLQKTHSLDNMYLLDENGIPHKFATPEDILKYFCRIRLPIYDKRKKYLLKLYDFNLKEASNRYNFVKAVVDKKLKMNQSDEKLEADMLEIGLEKMTKRKGVNSKEDGDGEVDGDGDDSSKSEGDMKKSFEYLLSMPMRSMTAKKLEELKKKIDYFDDLIKTLKRKSARDLWLEDLDEFDVAYKKFIKTRVDDIPLSKKRGGKRGGKKGAKKSDEEK